MRAGTIDVEPGRLAALGLRPPGSGADLDGVLTLRRRARAWAGAHRRSLVTLAVLSLVVAAVHAWGAGHSPSMSDDEGTYMAQAWAVQTHHQLAPYTYWYDHPPLGWLQISLFTWLSGAFGPSHHAVVVGRELMVVAAVASSVLLYVLCRRLQLRRSFAAVAVGMFALSPLAVDYQRLVFLDNVAVPWLLGSLVLAASPRRSLWAAAASGGCFAVAVLTKETLLLALPAVVVLLWERSDRRTRSFCFTGFGATAALGLSAYPLFALLKGELVPGTGHVSLVKAVQFQLWSRTSSGSVFDTASNAHHQLATWLHLDWWLLGLAVVSVPVGLVVARLRVAVAGFAVPVLVALHGGYLPDPFVIALLPFAALLVAGTLDVAFGPARRRVDASEAVGASRKGEASREVGALQKGRASREVGALQTGRASRKGRALQTVRRAAAAVLAVAVGAALVVHWAPGDASLVTGPDRAAPTWEAEAWVEAHVPHRDRLIVDDSVWVDLVEHGFDPHLGVVWFYKLDFTNNLDPSVARALPQGWRDLQYVVDSPIIRGALGQSPGALVPVRQAIAHSHVVASFGAGADLVQVRRIATSATTAATTTDVNQHDRSN